MKDAGTYKCKVGNGIGETPVMINVTPQGKVTLMASLTSVFYYYVFLNNRIES